MIILGYILIATFLLSFLALLGVFFLALNQKSTQNILLFLVSLSAGTLMGGAFLHLMPEGIQKQPAERFFLMMLASFILFYFIEKILHWQHCHNEEQEIHSFGYMSLIGSGVHHFIDGLIIATTFMIDIRLGMAAVIAIGLHEIPQEIGNCAILLYAGFNKTKALLLNLMVSLTMVAGGIIGYFIALHTENVIAYLLPLAAGGFLYISTSDLIPEIRKEKDAKKSFYSFGVFLIGLYIMYLAKLV
ncbi:MAG: ZIP family metal transporter [Candidatus Nealsonbacteria bacterium]